MKKIVTYLFLVLAIPAVLSAQVKINEVLYATSGAQIELKNFGATSVDVSNWWLCALFRYTQISGMTVISGSLNIPAGGILALSGGSITLSSTASDLGLYTSNDFASSAAMEHFVQWGSAGQGRESVAVSKEIWTAGDFMPTVAQGHSIEYDADGDASTDWFDQANPTIGSENGVVTSIDDEGNNAVPDEFVLAQNYPNPFNPTTTILYTIAESSALTAVKVDVFNALGQKVRTLVNAQQSPGLHSVQWDAQDDAGRLVASGLYYYRLQAGVLTNTKRMVLLQ